MYRGWIKKEGFIQIHTDGGLRLRKKDYLKRKHALVVPLKKMKYLSEDSLADVLSSNVSKIYALLIAVFQTSIGKSRNFSF